MAGTIAQICDPAQFGLEEAIEAARSCATARPGFELQVGQFLQAQCLSDHFSLPAVFRGLEVLGGMLSDTADENRLITLLRPFLKSNDPQIAAKCVLVLGRQSRSLMWLRNVVGETNERIRAKVIESLWLRKEPEVELVLQSALRDNNNRVAANAVYGLFLLGNDAWREGLDGLIGNRNAAFRLSGIWVVKSIAAPDAPSKLQLLIRDANTDVRRAAFGALKYLRERAENTAASSTVTTA
jgi:HEAT repeat protein